MTEELQQLKEQLKIIKLRSNGINELIEMKIKEAQGFCARQLMLENKITELESR